MIEFKIDYSSVAALEACLADKTSDEIVAALKVQDEDGETQLHLIVEKANKNKNRELFRTALKKLSPDERMEVITAKNTFNGETVLQWVVAPNRRDITDIAFGQDLINIAFGGLSTKQRLDALLIQNDLGDTPLHILMRHNSDLIGFVLDGFLPEEWIRLLKARKNKEGHTVLDILAKDTTNRDSKNIDQLREIVERFLDIEGGEKAFKQMLLEIRFGNTHLYDRIANLLEQAYMPSAKTAKTKIDIALRAARRERFQL